MHKSHLLSERHSPPHSPNPELLLRVFREVLQAKKEYEMTLAQETTKRQSIAAALQSRLEEIKFFKDIFAVYMNEEFKMRRESIVEIFARLDTALEANQNDVAIQALQSIEEIVEHSPLGHALAAMSTVFEKKDGILEI